MKEKTRQIALYVLMALIIVTMFTASLTLGRYSSEQSSDGGYGSDMEFILTTQVEVHSVDDFFLAIENGYTNLKVADDMDNPLIITSDTSNVKSDLIIDLNGHEIQRNNTTPLLQVQNGITLTIIDSKGGGSLYNPVGSVLQIGGSSTVEGSVQVTEGFLNVQAGIFESGPRNGRRNWTETVIYDEYAAGSGNSWSTRSGGRFEDAVTAEVYHKDSAPATDNDDGYTSLGGAQMPVIVPVTVENDTNYTVSGNMYFDENSTVAYGNNVITKDTYIFFTVEDDPSVESNFSYSVGSADYYYSYTLYYSEENGVRRYSADPQDGTPATVKAYIYNNVKGNSEIVTNGYAAIKMTAGEINVNGGDYHAYFGVDKSYCISVTGGMMEINSANSNFHAYENSVCVQCDYAENDPNKYLKISDGNFYSELGDTVVVSRGRTDIVSADFTKDASSNMFEVTGTSFTGEQLAAYYNANNSVIDITGGSLTISQSATFNITGSGVTGIRASGSGASVTTYNTTFNFYGGGSGSTLDSSFNRAVYTSGGNVTSGGATNILMARNKEGQTDGITSRYNVGVLAGGSSSVTFSGNAEIDINGNATPSGGNYGIYSTGGTITCGEKNSNSSTTITIAANSASTGNYGIYSTGGTITTRGTTEITLGNSAQAASLETLSRTNYGIFSEGGTVTCGEDGGTTNITINGTTQNVTVGTGENATVHTSQDNFGIYSGQLTTTEGSSTAGKISIAGMATIKINGAYSSGIDSDGGTINISGSSFKCYVTMSQNDTTLSSTAINTSGGNITVGAAHVDIQSNGLGVTVQGGNITFSDYSGTVPSDIVKGTAITATRGTALFVAGQNSYLHFEDGVEVKIESILTPGTTWASAEGSTETDNNVSLTNGVLIMGGSVYVNGSATVTSTVDSGDWSGMSANKAALSNFNGVYVQSGSLYVGSRMGENNQIEVTNAKALLDVTSSIESSGTTFPALTFNGGSYSGVYVQGGSLYSYGTLNVKHTGVQNDSVASGDTAFLNQTIKSYSVRVEGDNSTSVTITKGEITNSIGGGVYVSGGTTVLGESSANNLKVSTTGYGSYGSILLWDHDSSTWYYIKSQTGGHAVQVNGGNLTINNGEFTAAQGNGIIVNNGTANIYSGTFKGNDSGKGNIDKITGPGASAGLKVVGGTANIYGGTFGENSTTNNSGAFVMGTANARAKVNVVGGTFYAYGADAFTVFRYSTVTFDPNNSNNTISNATASGGDISVIGNGASALALTNDEIFNNDGNRGSTVNIYDGSYSSTNDAAWYGCDADTLNIRGGTFTGNSGNGLNIYVEVGADNINLYGGTFIGSSRAIQGGNGRITYGDLSAGGSSPGSARGININGLIPISEVTYD